MNVLNKQSPARSNRSGFLLLEVMIATGIFALAGVSLAVALNHTMNAVVLVRQESEIRLSLQTKLAEAKTQPLVPGKETSEPDSQGVQYEKEVKLLEFQNEKKQALHGLYSLTIRAKWKKASQEDFQEAQIYVYQP